MTTFDDRDKGFENKFAHEKESSFKITARRNKLLGLWAAGKQGMSGADAEQYARDIVLAEFEAGGDSSQDVVDRLLADFGRAKVALSERDIRAEMNRLEPIARKQILGDDAF